MKHIYFGVLFLFLPILVQAQIEITEIMYDLEGSDSKKEWIEIYNSGSGSVDLSDWRFNDGSNHTFAVPPEKGGQGSIVLDAGAVAIVASDAETFLSTHTVSVSVIDTVMSLNNTAETLQLKNAEGVVVEEVSYESEQGAAGDGLSLQKSDEQWIAVAPTPGVHASASEVPETEEEEDEEDSQQEDLADEQSSAGSSWPVEPQIFAFAGSEKRTTVTGGSIQFEGDVLGIEHEPLEGARYVWSFGDGSRGEGRMVMHTYMHPGMYVVMLDVSSGKYSATDRVYVRVGEADISVVAGDGFVALMNNADEEVDLSWWKLVISGAQFTLPEHTIILAGTEVRFADETTGLTSLVGENAGLQYPNGDAVTNTDLGVRPPSDALYDEEDLVTRSPSVAVGAQEEEGIGETEKSKMTIPTVIDAPTNNSKFVAVRDIFEDQNVVYAPQPVSVQTVATDIQTTSPIEEIEIILEKTHIATSAQVASVVSIGETKDNVPVWYWLIGVLGIALVGVLGVRHASPASATETTEADSYTLIDESEIDSNR